MRNVDRVFTALISVVDIGPIIYPLEGERLVVDTLPDEGGELLR
jgi:hypothetical protein